ncbi:MAG: hypothetical protein ABI321_09185 [Polyangia bacterium]
MKIILLACSICAPGLFASPGLAPRPSSTEAVSAAPIEGAELACSDVGRSCSVDRNCCSGTCSKGTCQ